MADPIELPHHFNVADHFLQINLQGERADRPYLRCGDETLTYRELERRTNRVGLALQRLGVEPENRVMLLMLDTPAFPPCFWGAVRIGAVAVPINTLLKSADYRYFLEDSRAKVLIVDEALWPLVEPFAEALPHLRHVVIANGRAAGRAALDELMAAEETALESEPMSPDDMAFWLYTSGSTGVPKAAVHLHRDMVHAAERYALGILELRDDDLTFSAAKYFFAYGLGNSLYFPMVAGGSAVVFTGRPTPEAMFETLARYRPTVFYGVPTLFNAMLNTYDGWLAGDDPPETLPNLNHLRFSISAGEALPADTYERWRRHFGSEILDGIGSTEMLHIFLSNRPGNTRPGSSGTPVPGYEAKLVDEDGEEIGEGEVGALLVKGESAAAFYWNKQEKTRSTMLGEWLVTGDQYLRDGDGFYWHQGRNDDMMKVSGSWVSPIEVENALLTHDAVAECAVVGQADEAGLTKAKAFVVLKPGREGGEPLAEKLKAHLRGKVAGFKIPRWIEFADGLPKTATGKIRRFTLRD